MAIFISKLKDPENSRRNNRIQLKNNMRMLPVVFGEVIPSVEG